LIRVPREIKEATYALGATRFEVVRKVMLPAVRNNVIGAVIWVWAAPWGRPWRY